MNRQATLSFHAALCIILFGVGGPAIRAQTFSRLAHGLPAIAFGSFALGDCDADGDLDLAIVGSDADEARHGGIYLNNGAGAFTRSESSIPQLSPGKLVWVDYDNDADLDLLAGGTVAPNEYVTKLFQNENGIFRDSGLSFPSMSTSAAAFADFDNDGRLDLVIAGTSAQGPVTKLLWNRRTGFVDAGLELPVIFRGSSLAAADCDADGDTDILLAPSIFTTPGLAEFGAMVLVNAGNAVFATNRLTINTGVGLGAAWADLDMDGRLDVTIAGNAKWPVSLFDQRFQTWRWAGDLTSLDEASVAIGDYDRDGRPDLLGMGRSIGFNRPATELYRNAGKSFFGLDWTSASAGLPGAWLGKIDFADIDGDGDLDTCQMGVNGAGEFGIQMHRNNLPGVFPLPAVPQQLHEVLDGSNVSLAWEGLLDARTFNVRVGTSPNGVDVLSPMADLATGRRKVAAMGNAGQSRTLHLRGLSPGRYYWSAQSIDAAFNGSAFAAERQFTILDAVSEGLRVSIQHDSAPNAFRITILGLADRRGRIEESADLQTWQTISPVLEHNHEPFAVVATAPRKFFRLRVVP